MPDHGPDASAVAPPSRLFLIGYVLAFVGAFVSVSPLLQILTPMRAGAIDAADKASVLSQAVFYGALAAGVANVAAGAISDRTRSRLGRRRPWIVIGALATAASYLLILRAQTPLALVTALVVWQCAFNLMFSPLVALFADRVPVARRGVMSAVVGMAYPTATAVGSAIMGWGPQGEAARFAVLAFVVIATTVPFALLSREPLPPAGAASLEPRRRISLAAFVRPFRDRDFALAWSGRFFIITGYAVVGVYLLYYLADVVRVSDQFAGGMSPEAGHSVVTAISLCGVVLVTLVAAATAWRFKRRKPYAALAGALLAGGAFMLALTSNWATVVGAFVLYGLGMGFYAAIEMALMTDVLPSEQDHGKDLGLINLAATLPQAIAPLLALVLLKGLNMGFQGLFSVAGLCFVAATFSILSIRRIR